MINSFKHKKTPSEMKCLTLGELSATYVTMSQLSIECYCQHISPKFWILRVYCSIVAVISTQLSMTSQGKDVAMNVIIFNMVTSHFMEIVQSRCSKTENLTANLDTNTIEYVSEMRLYIILSTLEKFEQWNQSVWITNYWCMKWCQVHSHPQ